MTTNVTAAGSSYIYNLNVGKERKVESNRNYRRAMDSQRNYERRYNLISIRHL